MVVHDKRVVVCHFQSPRLEAESPRHHHTIAAVAVAKNTILTNSIHFVPVFLYTKLYHWTYFDYFLVVMVVFWLASGCDRYSCRLGLGLRWWLRCYRIPYPLLRHFLSDLLDLLFSTRSWRSYRDLFLTTTSNISWPITSLQIMAKKNIINTIPFQILIVFTYLYISPPVQDSSKAPPNTQT